MQGLGLVSKFRISRETLARFILVRKRKPFSHT